MGCGSSTQVGATDNPTPTDELEVTGSHSGSNPVDGEVVDVEGESNGNLLDKSPLPPIKAGDKDNPHPTDETTTDGVLRPKTSNPNHRSPRRLPKLSGPIGSLPQVEDMNEDSSEEVDTTERGVGTNSNTDSVSIRSLNTVNPENGTEEKEDDDLDVVATPAISAKGSNTSVRSAQPTPVPPSSKDGSTLSLNAEGKIDEGATEEKPSAQTSRKSSMHSIKKSTLSLRKNSSHSLQKSTTSSRRASSTSKQEPSEHPDKSVEAPEVGNSSRRGSSEEEHDEPTAPANDPANNGTEEEETPSPPEEEGSQNVEEPPLDDATDSGTEVEGTPPEQEGSQNGEELVEDAEHDEKGAIEKSEEQNEPEDEGIHEESDDKPTDADQTATELADPPTEMDNETPMTANDLGTADPSRSNSAVQVS